MIGQFLVRQIILRSTSFEESLRQEIRAALSYRGILNLEAQQIVDQYRDVMEQLDQADSLEMERIFEKTAERLRDLWAAEYGTDSLHRTAFGESGAEMESSQSNGHLY